MELKLAYWEKKKAYKVKLEETIELHKKEKDHLIDTGNDLWEQVKELKAKVKKWKEWYAKLEDKMKSDSKNI